MLVLFVAWWGWCVTPALATRKELRGERAEIEALQARSAEVQTRLAQVTAAAADWRRQAELARQRCSPQRDEAGFLHWVNQQAQASGLVVRDFRPSGHASLGEYEGHTVMISSQGSYESICRFLDLFRSCPRMSRLTRIEIVPQGTGQDSYTFTVQVVLFAHTRKPTVTAASKS